MIAASVVHFLETHGLALGLGFSALVAGLIGWDASRPNKSITRRKGWWAHAPRFVLDPGCGVTFEELQEAVRWWEDLGWPISFVTQAPYSLANAYVRAGEVRVTMMTQKGAAQAGDTGNLQAYASRSVLATDEILYAEIGIGPQYAQLTKETRQLILRHEIGHVLGFEHVSRAGHVMSPTLALLGHDSHDLQRRTET